MYDLVDRPIDGLDRFESGVLQATRKWVHALSVSGSSRGDDGDRFGLVMEAIDQGSRDELMVCRPCAPLVSESEAILVSLWRFVRNEQFERARALAALIVDGRAGKLINDMRDVVHP